MKSNYFRDFIVNNDTLVNTSKSTGNTSIQPTQQDSLSKYSMEKNDSLVHKQNLLKGDLISKDSSLFVNDTITSVDTIQQIVVQQEPRFVGKEIARFQNIGLGNDWFVGVLLFSLFLLASAKFLFGKYLSKLVESIFNSHTANNLFLENNINMVKGSILLNFLFIVNISLFAVNVMNHLSFSSSYIYGFKEFALVFIGFSLLYLGKIIVIKSLGYIFKGTKESKEYQFTIFLYNKNLGLFLFPVIIALPFVQAYAVEGLIYTGVVMVLFFYVLRIYRGLKILFRKHVSLFYMILYLCALEILPLLMIYKLLLG